MGPDAGGAFGALAAPRQGAHHCEQALIGQPLNAVTVSRAAAALADDFQPLSDFRASNAYRLQVARNLLRRFLHRYNGEITCTEVTRYVS